MQSRRLIFLLPLAFFCISTQANAMLTQEQHKRLELFEQELLKHDGKIDGPVKEFMNQLIQRVEATRDDTAQALDIRGEFSIEEIISLHVEELIDQLNLNDEDGQTCRLLAREVFKKSLSYSSRKEMNGIYVTKLIMKALVVLVVFYLLFVPASALDCDGLTSNPARN
jgi:hypothetical protein